VRPIVLDIALQASVTVFMIGSLGGVGLGLSPRAALAPLTNARFVLVTLLASWVMTPAVAWAVVRIIPIDAPYATGLLLLALAPCAPFAPALTQIARGDTTYLAATLALSAVGTVLVMPFAIPLLVPGLSADALAIARPLVLFVLLPLLGGMAAYAAFPAAAMRLKPVVAAATGFAGAVLLLLVAIVHGRGVVDAIGTYAIAAQLAFLLAITSAAYSLGGGLTEAQRSVLTIGVCSRNLGAALAPLVAVEADPRAIVMIAISVPVTLIIGIATARWLAHHHDAERLAAHGL
jgi:BASS family bile acid:Na+ symporter